MNSKVWYGECNMHIEKSEKRMLNRQVRVLAKEIRQQSEKIQSNEKELSIIRNERDMIASERDKLMVKINESVESFHKQKELNMQLYEDFKEVVQENSRLEETLLRIQCQSKYESRGEWHNIPKKKGKR